MFHILSYVAPLWASDILSEMPRKYVSHPHQPASQQDFGLNISDTLKRTNLFETMNQKNASNIFETTNPSNLWNYMSKSTNTLHKEGQFDDRSPSRLTSPYSRELRDAKRRPKPKEALNLYDRNRRQAPNDVADIEYNDGDHRNDWDSNSSSKGQARLHKPIITEQQYSDYSSENSEDRYSREESNTTAFKHRPHSGHLNIHSRANSMPPRHRRVHDSSSSDSASSEEFEEQFSKRRKKKLKRLMDNRPRRNRRNDSYDGDSAEHLMHRGKRHKHSFVSSEDSDEDKIFDEPRSSRKQHRHRSSRHIHLR